MAATITTDTRSNKNYEVASFQARGGGLVIGLISMTYSGTGGMTITGLGFQAPFFMSVAPASQYIFEWRATTSQLKAYSLVVTSTALASVLVEVGSDTDFTALGEGGIRFAAFGYGGG